MERNKIMFISAAKSIHTVRWVNALSEYFEIHLVYCKNHKPNIDNIKSEVQLHELPYNAPIGYYSNALYLKKIYKHIKPDMVNVHYASGYATLARKAKLKNVLLSVWGSDVYDFPNESKFKKKILEKNVLYADRVASTSNIMAEELKKHVKNIKEDIYITPFGVDINKFKKIDTKKSGNEIIIGNVKSLDNEIYGIDYEILAVKKLKENLINQGKEELANKIKLHIYGDGKDKEYLQSCIDNNNANDYIFLKGRIPNEEVPRVLNQFDIFCITSNKESFGVSIIEAMACELPVVATDADGFKEVIEDNKTGIIVPRKDINSIANALEKIIENYDLGNGFGKNGRQRVVELYDWKKNVENMKTIYDEILERKK